VKIALMVAAGVAVGLTVVVAVLVQILVQLAPVLVVGALAALVLYVLRRRGRGQVAPTAQWVPYPAVPPPAAPTAAALPRADISPAEELHLRWGPPETEHRDVAPAMTPYGAGTHVRRARAGSRPSRAARARRP
jgi:hypothetical protein